MAREELRIDNRVAYFRKAITSPDFESERVLARDAFQFAELWLKRNCVKALPYWDQAKSYYVASKNLPTQSSPLTNYYCFLNAAKALLTVKSASFAESHGISGDFDPASKRSLSNEIISFKGAGIVAELSKVLSEKEATPGHSLRDILSNLPFIHRAYRYTFRSQAEKFIPVRNVTYWRNPKDNYIWISARIEGRFADKRSMKTLPSGFEVDQWDNKGCTIRPKHKIKWRARGASTAEKNASLKRLFNYHQKHRQHLVYISSAPDLWYIKRDVGGAPNLMRYNLTLIMAAMHRLSELSRYDPKGLSRYLEGKENWLLTEFIELSPSQFIDELVCEMTSLEFGSPGVRPRSS